ncbi:uncharacterized protein PGTG_01484 [Puccinia graminis f. sp. tritici CRL 75-36-700-3]|uniref:No apical meristem-associated C-terminal domain-containing protein n=1 Tax=Puccinia graminis f. sp. tritici (strain CRL 75-36-700-3 / race SCCL) TaxID=418459 RepID=E3JS20_PUCGT|nr:uncharacterized protein PGTG_01484 [Puccinia graminis f. sp. tritici CRL 75-36-700-3]EFP74891.1 hypothetical protein PGTG_01484 [Puccinia graminis f. sp. tritici CRL 75-36-700-3]
MYRGGRSTTPTKQTPEGKRKEKRKKGPTYQDHEDAQLSSSWVEVSEDPSVGTDQAGSRFWDRISKCYHDAIPQPPRPIGSLKGRWQLISHGVSKFAGCVKHIDQLNPSGATSEDRLTKALALFSELQGKTFGFLQCYNILTSSPKWSDYFQDMNTKTAEGPKKKKKRARSPSSEAPPLTSEQASDTETPSETPDRPEPERPGGKKRAKAILRDAATEARIMKDMATAQAEIASQSKRQNDIYQSQTQTMQNMADAAIMNKDISGLDEVTQEFYRLQREQIMLKLRERSRAEAEQARVASTQASCSTPTQATTSSSNTQATTSSTNISNSTQATTVATDPQPTTTSIDIPQCSI